MINFLLCTVFPPGASKFVSLYVCVHLHDGCSAPNAQTGSIKKYLCPRLLKVASAVC